MLILIFLVAVILGIVFPKSRVVTCIEALTMILIVGFRYRCPDISNYQLEYGYVRSGIEFHSAYPGYFVLQKLAAGSGFTFEGFLIFAAVISTVLLLVGIIQLTSTPNLVLSLFLVFPFSYEAAQMKSFLADALVIAALPFLLKAKDDNKLNVLNVLIYFSIAFVAVTMHYSAAFFIIVGLLYLFVSVRKRTATAVAGMVISAVAVYSGALQRIVAQVFQSQRANAWLQSKTNWGWLVPVLGAGMIYFLCDYASKTCARQIDEKKRKHCLAIGACSQFILLTVPFLMLDITFDRLFRVFLVLCYVLMGEMRSTRLEHRVNKRIYYVLCIVCIGYLFFIESDSPRLLSDILTYNRLIG